MPAPPGKRRKTIKSMPLKGGEPHEASTTPSAPVRKPAPKAKASVIEVEDSPKLGAPEDAETTAGKVGAPEDAEKKAEDKKDALPELEPVPSLDLENAALPEGEGKSATETEVKVEEEHEEEEESGELPAGVGEAFEEPAAAALPAGEVNSGGAPEAEVLEEEAAEESDDDMDEEWEFGKFGQDYEDARKALLEDETDSE